MLTCKQKNVQRNIGQISRAVFGLLGAIDYKIIREGTEGLSLVKCGLVLLLCIVICAVGFPNKI